MQLGVTRAPFSTGAVVTPPSAGAARRLADTRRTARLQPGATLSVPWQPASWGPKAIVVTLTIANPMSAGFATVYACDDPPPPTSTINFVAGETRAATTIVSTPASPTLCVTTSTAADVIVDDVAQLA